MRIKRRYNLIDLNFCSIINQFGNLVNLIDTPILSDHRIGNYSLMSVNARKIVLLRFQGTKMPKYHLTQLKQK